MQYGVPNGFVLPLRNFIGGSAPEGALTLIVLTATEEGVSVGVDVFKLSLWSCSYADHAVCERSRIQGSPRKENPRPIFVFAKRRRSTATTHHPLFGDLPIFLDLPPLNPSIDSIHHHLHCYSSLSLPYIALIAL